MIFGDFWKNLLFRLFTNDLPESGGNGKKNPVSYPVYRAVRPGRSEGGYGRDRDYEDRKRSGRGDGRRDWDNDTGRTYRSFRDRDGGERRPYRQGEGGEGRRRNAPKPYGYDTFMSTKKREGADAFWLRNTEIRKYDDEVDE